MDMRCKEAAQALGISIDSLKRLEVSGLIPAPRRSRSGHRHYTPEILAAARAAYFPADPQVRTPRANKQDVA